MILIGFRSPKERVQPSIRLSIFSSSMVLLLELGVGPKLPKKTSDFGAR